MTSSFAEFRRTHFHGGVDIGTGSTTGYEVYAMRDGYVSRIKVSPTGYGKMLFVRHNDGYSTTYAHLNHFNAEIDARAHNEQQRLECYPVDIECSPNEFPVRKGDLIAYTGETGVGTPHLHFEIRDPWMDFVNPLQCSNLAITDDISPTIKRLAFSPIGGESQGAERPREHVYSVRQVRRNEYRLHETIELEGNGGFAIEARDRSNGSNFRHGVYGHQLFVDDSLVYAVRLDRAPSTDAHQIALYYDWDLIGRGRLERLYVNSPNTFRFYSPGGDKSGILGAKDFAEGPHVFRIQTMDFAGNTSTVTGSIIFHHQKTVALEMMEKDFVLRVQDTMNVQRVLMYFKKDNATSWNLKTLHPQDGRIVLPMPEGKYDVIKVAAESNWGFRSTPLIHYFKKPTGSAGRATLHHEIEEDFVRITAKTTQEFSTPPTVTVYEGLYKRVVPLTPVDVDHYVGSFVPFESHQGVRRLVLNAEVNGHLSSANSEFTVYPIVAGSSGSISFDDGNMVLTYEPTSVFKTVFMRIEKGNDGSYKLLPENTVLNSGLNVSMKGSPSKQRQGLFFNGLGSEDLLDTSLDSAKGTFDGRITRSFGEIYLESDHTPPGISRLRISGTSGGRPVISFRYGDGGSGVEYRELKMYINNIVAVPEIDGEHHRAIHRVATALERGSHLLTIRIKDKLGNSTEVERRFTVR